MAIEKVWLPKEARIKKDGTTEIVEPWEIRATGKDVQALKGALKENAEKEFHEHVQEDEKIGMEKITRPDGSVDEVRADWVPRLRQEYGFCRHAVRSSISINGFGSMRARGLTRYKAIYRDGVRTVVEER